MRSAVGEALRDEDEAEDLRRSASQRMESALRRGREAVCLYAQMHDISVLEAEERLRRLRNVGRRACSWNR